MKQRRVNKMLNRKTKYLLGQTIFHIVVILLGFLMLYPILWMVSNSFKTNAEIFGSSSLIPKSLSLEHYIRGWRFNNTITFTTFFSRTHSTIRSSQPLELCLLPVWLPMALQGTIQGQIILVCMHVPYHDDSLSGSHGSSVHHLS